MISGFHTNGGKPGILITGASGMLGEALCRAASTEWSVYGVRHQHPLDLSGVAAVQADLTDFNKVGEMLDAVKPGAVIHAAAMAQPAFCEEHPRRSAVVNAALPEIIARWCAKQSIPMVLISTDLVFDGRRAPYAEDHLVTPLCVYARHKVQAEKAVLARCPDGLVARMPLLIGIPPRHQPANFTVRMLNDFQQGRAVQLFSDEIRTPVDPASAARGVLTLLGKVRGMIHLGGRTRISRYEMGRMLAAHLGAPLALARPVSTESLALALPRSPDCSLESSRAYALGYDPVPLAAAIKAVVEQFKVISIA